MSAGTAVARALSSAATHLVGIESVVTDHLHPFLRNVLSENSQKINGIKDFEVSDKQSLFDAPQKTENCFPSRIMP